MSWQPDRERITFPSLTGAVCTTGPTVEPAAAAGQAMASSWPGAVPAAPGPPRSAVPSLHAVVPEAMTGPLSMRTDCSTTAWYREPEVSPVGDP